MATFIVLQGPDKGRTLQTDDDVAVIGRGSEQLPITDQTVSRKHAELSFNDDAVTLRDLKSSNGTYLNGARLTRPARLKHGDQIRVGATVLVYGGDDSKSALANVEIPRDMVQLDAGSAASGPEIISSSSVNDDSMIIMAPETAWAVRSWRAMRQLNEVLGSGISTEQFLLRVLDIIFEEIEVDRGVVFVVDEQTGELLPDAVHHHGRRGRKGGREHAIVAPRSILNHVVETRNSVLCTNAVGDQRFSTEKSVQFLGKRSVICAPIVARERVIGAIYLDCSVQRHTFNEHELRLVGAIGYQAGLAMENARLVLAQLERERLAAVGETVAYLSHSIKNILQGMRAGSDVTRRGLEKRDLTIAEQGWRILDRNLDKCYALMLNMLAFSKTREPHLESMQANRIVADVLELVQKQADEAKVVLVTDLDDTAPPLPVDADGLHQVLLNLVLNAVEFVPPGKGVIRVGSRFDAAQRALLISVADNGPGVSADVRAKLFTPFFSTKGHGGTGLGLAVSRKIMREMGGDLALGEAGEGAEFVVTVRSTEAKGSSSDTQAPKLA